MFDHQLSVGSDKNPADFHISVVSVTNGGFAKIQLRDMAGASDFASSLGVALPQPMQMVQSAVSRCIALAPCEWLIWTNEERQLRPLVEAICSSLSQHNCLITNMSHGLVHLHVAGRDAQAALSAYCPLDLSETAFPAGYAKRSLIGDVRTLIVREAAVAEFDLIIDQSAAPYMARLLNALQNSGLEDQS